MHIVMFSGWWGSGGGKCIHKRLNYAKIEDCLLLALLLLQVLILLGSLGISEKMTDRLEGGGKI